MARSRIDLAIAEESIQQRAVLYDKQGDAHFDTISAFIKSLRGSDPDAALFWLARMVEAGENPRFIFRRMLIAAGEDIGLADPQAIVVVEACAAAFERVGLPEGLYPLAQAALYLAATEKSNSALAFFDALKTVRATARQEVPSHLRDANRDGPLFGDGVGYRYPHAYAEHWVAQQYLPGSLQGEVFWQPGTQGWEGAQRQRLHQRRAAQLAAAAETHLSGHDWLSSGPEDPQLERWLQRQAGAEGATAGSAAPAVLAGGPWRRHQRVLLLEGQSLLWALDPLQATPEGGVVIAVADSPTAERLEAQLQVLDSLRRPRIVLIDPADPEQLLRVCGDQQFEWIAARQPWRQQPPEVLARAWACLAELLAPGGQCRLLFSAPQLGPASRPAAPKPGPGRRSSRHGGAGGGGPGRGPQPDGPPGPAAALAAGRRGPGLALCAGPLERIPQPGDHRSGTGALAGTRQRLPHQPQRPRTLPAGAAGGPAATGERAHPAPGHRAHPPASPPLTTGRNWRLSRPHPPGSSAPWPPRPPPRPSPRGPSGRCIPPAPSPAARGATGRCRGRAAMQPARPPDCCDAT
jgi:hypothetical protein